MGYDYILKLNVLSIMMSSHPAIVFCAVSIAIGSPTNVMLQSTSRLDNSNNFTSGYDLEIVERRSPSRRLNTNNNDALFILPTPRQEIGKTASRKFNGIEIPMKILDNFDSKNDTKNNISPAFINNSKMYVDKSEHFIMKSVQKHYVSDSPRNIEENCISLFITNDDTQSIVSRSTIATKRPKMLLGKPPKVISIHPFKIQMNSLKTPQKYTYFGLPTKIGRKEKRSGDFAHDRIITMSQSVNESFTSSSAPMAAGNLLLSHTSQDFTNLDDSGTAFSHFNTSSSVKLSFHIWFKKNLDYSYHD